MIGSRLGLVRLGYIPMTTDMAARVTPTIPIPYLY